MLSFNQLQEKKTKVKINPKKDEIVEGNKKKKDDSYLEVNFKKRQDNNEKARKEMDKVPSQKNPHFESTGDQAYGSQEEVSEESTEEVAETEILLTFNQYQHAQTLDEEQLDEFLDKLFGGGKKPAGGTAPGGASGGNQMPSHVGLASKLGQRRQMMNKLMGKSDTGVLGYSKGGKVKNESILSALSDASGGTRMSSFARGGAGKDGRNYGRVSTSNDIGPNTPVVKPPSQRPVLHNPVQKNTSSKFLPNRLSKGNIKKEEVEIIKEFGAMSGAISKSFKKGPLGKVFNQSVSPGGGNALGVQNAATSAGGGMTFTNNAQLLARSPASYTRGVVPKPAAKAAPPVTSSTPNKSKPLSGRAMMGRPGMGSGTKPMSSKSMPSTSLKGPKTKRESHLRRFSSFLDERTRYAKETGKDPQTGNPSEKGGTIKPGSAMSKVRKSLAGQGLMSSRRKAIQPQGKKKEKGKKGYEGPTPVDKIKGNLSRKRAPKPEIGSRFD